jgi:tRNA pseudouridine55 synthase
MELPTHACIEEDVYLVHKPKGYTSFDLVKKFKKTYGIKKAGHAGTLDPLAYGLMIIGINRGTKKMNHYLTLPKVYIAEVLLGTSTTTLDAEGEVLEDKHVVGLKSDDIETAVDSLVGDHEITAPLYSAIKVEGKPLYWYARNNVEPPYIPVKNMKVRSVAYLDSYKQGSKHIIKIRIEVSSGTYIRSLAVVLGEALGYPAMLHSLYRYTIGDHCDCDAIKIEEV